MHKQKRLLHDRSRPRAPRSIEAARIRGAERRHQRYKWRERCPSDALLAGL